MAKKVQHKKAKTHRYLVMLNFVDGENVYRIGDEVELQDEEAALLRQKYPGTLQRMSRKTFTDWDSLDGN